MAAALGLVVRRGSGVSGLAGLRTWGTRAAAAPALSVRSGLSLYFLKSPFGPPTFLPIHFYYSDSGLAHILGISKEEDKYLVGQHAPPVSAFQDDHKDLLKKLPDQPTNSKVLKIAIIGAPNAGKSTLSNQLLGRKVLPVSQKVHTTRRSALGIVTKDDTQLIILDTPGLTTSVKRKRHHLEESLLNDPFRTLKKADLVVVLVDVSEYYTRERLSPQVLRALSSVPEVPSVLVLNKVDLLKKKCLLLHLVTQLTEGIVHGRPLRVKSLLKVKSRVDSQAPGTSRNGAGKAGEADPGSASDMDAGSEVEDEDATVIKASPGEQKKMQKGWPHFKEVFMLAAVHGEEVETLKKYLLQQATPGPWRFHSEVLTSQSPQEICENSVREKLLEYLPQEVPYTVVQETEMWKEGPSGELVIVQNLLVQKETHVKMLLGHKGETITRVAKEAASILMNAFLCDVHLKLCVKLKE